MLKAFTDWRTRGATSSLVRPADDMIQPDLSFLTQALTSLEEVLEMEKTDIVRDSAIQRFEYTFELSWKSLKKYFKWNQNLDESNVKNLFREAARQGFIEKSETWFEFHRARNQSSHTYNVKIAEEVYAAAKSFLPQAKILLKKLEKAIK